MDAIEPLISSSVTGPLGIAHLPRLWLKVLLSAHGRLADGYRAGEGGFDGGIYKHFGVDGDAFVAFVKDAKPTYLELEKWFAANAGNLTPSRIVLWNTYIRSANLPAERATLWRERFGIEDDSFANGVTLNDLDDWACFHERLTARPSA